MHEAIEILESYGIVRDADSQQVIEIVGKKVERLHQQLFSAIVTKQENDYYADLSAARQLDPFTFLAGRSLGGDVCSEFDCRLNRLDMLGRYAALYSNQVILPLPLTASSDLDGPKDVIREISQTSLALLRLRPLVDAGIVYPVVRRSFHCEHTLKWCEDMKRIVHKATGYMLKARVDDFVVKFQIPEKAPTGIPSIYIEGPEDFLEHGHRILLFGEMPGWRLKKWRFDKEGKVEVQGLRKAAVLSGIFNGIGEDTSFYLAYGRNRNARLLTNLRGEAMLLSDLTSDIEVSASSAALNDCMNHTLPLLADLPISRLLAIRRDERDSFERYRIAIRQILMDVSQRRKRISKKDVRQLFQERIEPELAKMKSELYQERRKQRRRIGAGLSGLAAMAAGVAMGAFGGIVPGVTAAATATGVASGIVPAIAKAAMAVAPGIAGTSLLGKAAQSYCEHGATLKEKNDFYFLLRLTQEAEG